MLLSATTETLVLTTASAVAIDWSAWWIDHITSASIPTSTGLGSAQGTVTTATMTTMVVAPAASTHRQVRFVSVRNLSPINPQTVTIAKMVAAVATQYPSITLDPGDTLYFNNEASFFVINNTGQVKGVGPAGPTGPAGPGVSDGDHGDITVSGSGATWELDNAVVEYANIQAVSANKVLGSVAGGMVSELDCSATGRSVIASTVAAKGDVFAGTAPATVGILTAGGDETVLATKASETTGLRYQYRSRLLAPPITADGSPWANSTAESGVLATIAVGATMNVVGAACVLTFAGEQGNTTGPPTLTFRLKFGGTTIYTLAVSQSVAATNAGWTLQLLVTTRSTGVGGSMHVQLVSGYTRVAINGNLAPSQVTAVDTTTGDFTMTTQWSAANALNTIQVDNAIAQALNF